MKQSDDVPGQRIADLLAVFEPFNGKGDVVGHGEEDVPVDFAEDPFALLQYLFGNFQEDGIDFPDQVHCAAPFGFFLKGIDRAALRRIQAFGDLSAEADPLSD